MFTYSFNNREKVLLVILACMLIGVFYYFVIQVPVTDRIILSVRVKFTVVVVGMCIKNIVIHLYSYRFLSYFSTCRHTVNEKHLDVIFAYITCKKHTVAHFAAKLCRLKVCNNNNALAD